MVRAGSYRHQLAIEQRSITPDAAGEPANTWTTFAQVRCSVEFSPGREVWASAQRNARVPTIFRIRYLAGVLPSMRIVFDGRYFDIKSSVDQEARKEELIITAEEHVEGNSA